LDNFLGMIKLSKPGIIVYKLKVYFMKKRIKRLPKFKKKIALEALKERETINEIAAKYGVHPVQVSQWKKELEDKAEQVFASEGKVDKNLKSLKEEKIALERLIGKQTIELEWLKKKLDV